MRARLRLMFGTEERLDHQVRAVIGSTEQTRRAPSRRISDPKRPALYEHGSYHQPAHAMSEQAYDWSMADSATSNCCATIGSGGTESRQS
jgi:hypothetical protein